MSQEAGREDFGVVGDDEIIWGEELGQVRYKVVRNRLCLAVNQHEARGVARIGCLLSDAVLWEVVSEICKQHGAYYTLSVVAWINENMGKVGNGGDIDVDWLGTGGTGVEDKPGGGAWPVSF